MDSGDRDIVVAVIHAHSTTRRGLEGVLQDGGFRVERPEEVEGWASTGRRALVYELDDERSLQRVDRLTRANAELVVVGFVHRLDARSFVDAMCVGSVGVVDQAEAGERLSVVLNQALAGCVEVPVEVARRLSVAAEAQLTELTLTADQKALLHRLAAGATEEATAAGLGVSVRTVQRRKQALFALMQVRNSVEAVAVGVRNGLLD